MRSRKSAKILFLMLVVLFTGCVFGCTVALPNGNLFDWKKSGQETKYVGFHLTAYSLSKTDLEDHVFSIISELVGEGQANTREFEAYLYFLIEKGDLDSAQSLVETWRKKFPEDARGIFALGSLQIVQGNISAGLELLEQAKGFDDTLNGLDSLIRNIKVSNLEEMSPYQKMQVGRAYASIGEWHFALVFFTQSIVMDPQFGEGWGFLGEAEQQVGLDGRQSLERALQLAPNSAIVHIYASFYWQRHGNLAEALKEAEIAARIEPEQPMWQAQIGLILALSGDINRALVYYQQAVELAPDDSLYWQLLAQFSADYDIELNTIGLPAARQALVLLPDDPGVLRAMADVLYKLNDMVGAERFLQQSLEISKDPSAYLRLAQIYIQQMKLNEAYIYLSLVIEDPGSSTNEVELAKRLLQQYFEY